ncbi:hypothetical protein [Kitasatospora sp. P5_F3]
MLRDLLARRIGRIDWPFPALELAPPGGPGWFITRLPRWPH